MADIAITYDFTVTNGQAFGFTFVLDPQTGRGGGPLSDEPAAWTELAFHRCPHCPLPAEPGAICPVAVNIESVITTLGFLVSHETIGIRIVSPERTLSATVPAQSAISSLLGLAIATSGCPHTAFLKPMARFHLPLASLEETLFRVIGTFLIGECLRAKRGGSADLALNGIKTIYDDLEVMNHALAKRLKAARSLNEAVVNALIILNTYAQSIGYFLDDGLAEIELLFETYLRKPPTGLGA